MNRQVKVYSHPLKAILLIVMGISSVLIIVGTFRNGGQKYIKFSSESCESGYLDTFTNNKFTCCDGSSNRICSVSTDTVNRIMVTLWSWLIALIPFTMTLAGEKLRKCLDLNTSIKRLKLYVGIFVFPKMIQNVFQPPDSTNCWYANMTTKKRCRDRFDFSDHVVFYMIHYMLVASLELSYVSERVGSQLSTWHYFFSIFSSFLIIASTMRFTFFTTLYFHSPLENIVALIISLPVIFLFFYLSHNCNIMKALGFVTIRAN
eukprot:gene11909-24945_t